MGKIHKASELITDKVFSPTDEQITHYVYDYEYKKEQCQKNLDEATEQAKGFGELLVMMKGHVVEHREALERFTKRHDEVCVTLEEWLAKVHESQGLVEHYEKEIAKWNSFRSITAKYATAKKSKAVRRTKKAAAAKAPLVELKPSLPILEQVRSELTRSELTKFQKMWNEIIQQFKFDVTFSEQKKIKDWIVFQIRGDKEAVKQKELAAKIDNVVEQIEASPRLGKQKRKQLEQQHATLIAELAESERLYQTYHELHTKTGKNLLKNREKRGKNV